MMKKDKILAVLWVILIVGNILLWGISIGKNIEKDKNEDPAITIARGTEEKAIVIVKTINGNVFEFSSDEYDIADNRITVFFE